MHIKSVIFDLVGTLLNTYEDLANAVNYGLKKYSYPTHDAEKYKIFTGNGTETMIKRALPEAYRDNETYMLIKEAYLEYYNTHSGEYTRAYDGINELLQELKKKGIKIAVTSNKIDCMTRQVIDEYFPGYFDFVIGQYEGCRPKPNPDMVIKAMSNMSVTPQECLYVGDTGVDAMTGKQAGIFTIGVLWGFRDEQELIENGADVVISQPLELLNYIK